LVFSSTIVTITILQSIAKINLATLISKQNNEDGEKIPPFECRFDPNITQNDYHSHHDVS